MKKLEPLSDTSPEAEKVLIELLRNEQPWEKLQQVSQLNSTMRTQTMSGIKHRHPELNEQQVRRNLMDQLLGAETAEKVYGPAD
jgi:hypothetical protein